MIDEVNFWQPGGNQVFRRLKPGEPFFFKLHSPLNYIAGGGFYAHSTTLPVSEEPVSGLDMRHELDQISSFAIFRDQSLFLGRSLLA